MRFVIVIKLWFFITFLAVAQDTISCAESNNSVLKNDIYRFKPKSLIIPSILVLYGATGLLDHQWNGLNIKIQEKVVNDWNNPFNYTHVDDYLVALPALSVYGLNLAGVNGKHNFFDRSLIIGTACVVGYTTVQGLKSLTHNLRPDGTTYDSWPSGHTALAFAGAEFLYQEYKDKSVLYGVSGYLVASTVGALRVYNNRHWVTDVVAGAGIGILSTKVTYWMFPTLSRLVDKVVKPKEATISRFSLTPQLESSSIGLHLVVFM